MPSFLRKSFVLAVLSISVAGCGGGGGYGGGGGPGGGNTPHTLGGTVTGLAGTGLTIRNNATDLAIAANGAFTFPGTLADGVAYAVTVTTHPSAPRQLCSVTGGTGTMNGSNVTSVAIQCSTTPLSPLTVTASTPVNGATGVSRTAPLVLTFSVPLAGAPVDPVSLTGPSGITGFAFFSAGAQLTVTPAGPLAPLTPYTLTVRGLSGDAGEQLEAPVVIHFTTADAQWQATAPVEANNNLGTTEFPQIAFDSHGNALAVWSENNGFRNIWANRYTPAGGWGTPELIETGNGGDAFFPQIGIDAAGNGVAVWGQADGTRINVWSNRYRVGGGWGTAELIETNNAGPATALTALTVNANGNAVAAWGQSDGTRYSIWANRYVSGTGWGTAELVEADDAGDALFPRVAFAANGDGLAVWQQQDGTRNNIWSNRYVSGAGWGAAKRIETDDAADAFRPQIACDTNGNVLAVWSQSDGTRFNVWSNRSESGGDWGSAELIESDDAGDASDPQIAFDATGNALAVWEQSDGSRTNIWSSRYTPAEKWGTAALIETDNAGNARLPHIAFDPKGNALAVWEQSDGILFNVWANRYTPASGWNAAELIEADAGGNATNSQVAIDTDGRGLAIWDQVDGDFAGNHYNISSNRFD